MGFYQLPGQFSSLFSFFVLFYSFFFFLVAVLIGKPSVLRAFCMCFGKAGTSCPVVFYFSVFLRVPLKSDKDCSCVFLPALSSLYTLIILPSVKLFQFCKVSVNGIKTKSLMKLSINY